MAGIRTTFLQTVSYATELMANSADGTGRISIASLATQMASEGALADRLDGVGAEIQDEVFAARDAAVAAGLAQSAFSASTISSAVSAGISGTSSGENFYATGADIDYIGLYANSGGAAVEYEDARLPRYGTALLKTDVEFDLGSLSSLPAVPSTTYAVTSQNSAKHSYVDKLGQTRVAKIKAKQLNGDIRPEAQIGLGKQLYGGRYLGHSLFTANMGQSLAATHVGGKNLTLSQVARSYAYTRDKDGVDYTVDRHPADPMTYPVSLPLLDRDAESPMFGLMSHSYEIMERERGLTPNDYGMYRSSVNTGAGSAQITQLNKGNALYSRVIEAAAQEKAWGDANGVPVICPGNLWSQGEAESTRTKSYYLEKLTELALDLATDIRAHLDGSGSSFDQTFDPHLFTYATCSRPLDDVYQSSAPRAQLQAAVDYYNGVTQPGQSKPAPIILTTPMYHMSYIGDTTGVHVPAEWAYVIGAYGALAIQRMFIDEWDDDDPEHALSKRWAPMHPIDVRFIGNTALIKYKMRQSGVHLQFGISNNGYPNGDGVTEQENYGFAVRNVAGDGYEAISTPEIVAPDTVAIRLSSGSFSDGHRIGYAMDNPAEKWTFFTGNAGNLRDNHGDFHRCHRVNVAMHNWLSPHFITKDTSPAGWTMS